MSTPKKVAASLAILAAVGAFMSFGVFSLFSSTTTNTSDLTSATFGLDQLPTVLLDTINDLIPGDTITRCVKLTNSGSTPLTATVTADMTNGAGSTLNSVAKMSMDEVSNVDTSTSAHIKACDATAGHTVTHVADIFASTVGSSLSALGAITLPPTTNPTWASSESHVYRVVITLPSSVTDFATYGGEQITPSVSFTADQIAGSAK